MSWIEYVREENSICHFVIALTKTDMIDKSELENIAQNVNSLITNQIDNSETQLSTPFIPTSGKTLQNVNELFVKAAEFYNIDKESIQVSNNDVDLKESNQSNSDSKCKC